MRASTDKLLVPPPAKVCGKPEHEPTRSGRFHHHKHSSFCRSHNSARLSAGLLS